MTYVQVPGAKLFTRIDGADRGDAPWLVLSNSLAADHTMWDPQIPLLTSRYRVLRYDTRGHGRSDAPAGPYSFAMLVDDVVRIMDHHGVGKATFMGLSLGGMIGLGLAIEHGGRIDKLVCCDARADAPEPYVKAWDERLAVIDKEGLRGILQGDGRALAGAVVPRRAPGGGGQGRAHDPRNAARRLQGLRRGPETARLPEGLGRHRGADAVRRRWRRTWAPRRR